MKLKFNDIEIEAPSVEEVRELLSLVVIKPVCQREASESGSGPNEIRYNEVTGKRLRLTKEELEQGVSREQVAAMRLQAQTQAIPALPQVEGEQEYEGEDLA